MRRSEHGASAVEFALIVPVLIALLFGIVEFGYQYNRRITITNAALIGARAMASGSTQATALSLARTAAGSSATYTITTSPTTCTPGTPVKMTIVARQPALTDFFGATFTIEGDGTARCEA